MRRLWIAVALLAVMLGGTLGNAWYLGGVIDGYQRRLTTAQDLAGRGAWEQAEQLTSQVYQDWQDRDSYFYILMRHVDTDAIYLTFQEVREYLKLEEMDQYTAANARLVAQLGLLAEMEQLTLKNVL